MHEAETLSLDQIEAFLNASEEIRFEGENRQQVYGWVEQVLRLQQYQKQSRKARGVLRRYLENMTGLSRAQVTRLIARYRAKGELQPAPYRRHRFPQRYTRADIELLATVDEAHETLSGPATRRILQREYQDYGKPEYQRLASISVAHLYNLRHHQRLPGTSNALHQNQTHGDKHRRAPTADPQGQPGYLRVDTVHQGDRPGAKGVYHSNAVDEVTQWEIVSATAHISEAWLEPVLAAMLRQCPFPIRGFHSDNGSEFINQTVARLLHIWGARCGESARRVLLGAANSSGRAYSVRGARESAALRQAPHGLPPSRFVSTILLDLWFERVVKPRQQGEACMVRYIDDFLLCFQYRADALRVQEALAKRLGRFGLTLEPTKTKLVEFGRFAHRHASKRGRKRPETIYFLGFTLYCTRNQKGNSRIRMLTEKTRLRRALMRLQDQMRRMRHLSLQEQVNHLNQMLRGHYAYYGVAGNLRALLRIHRAVEHYWRKMLSSRRWHGTIRLEQFQRIREQFPLLRPKLYLPYPTLQAIAIL